MMKSTEDPEQTLHNIDTQVYVLDHAQQQSGHNITGNDQNHQYIYKRKTKDIEESASHRPNCISNKGLPAQKLEYVDDNKMVRKFTLGQRDISKRKKSIILVGETGTGKTTLINSLINYFLGVTKDDWFEISEVTNSNQTQAQHLTVYEVFIETSPISWSIIDTPGYGGTQDMRIMENFLTLLKYYDAAPSIDAIGFVVTAALNRLDNRQLYIFDAAQSLFGRDVRENIVVFITHAGERTHHNVLTAIQKANVPVAKDKNNQPIHFLYDNIQSERENASDDLYKAKWEMGQRSTECFIASLETFETHNLEMTKTVLTHHRELEFSIIKLMECIQCIESNEKDLEKINNDIKESKSDEEVSENEGVKQYKEKVPISKPLYKQFFSYSTCCKSCEENCHEKCRCISKRMCKVMNSGMCKKCKCSRDEHVREKKKYETKTKTVTPESKVKKASNDIEYKQKTMKEAELRKGIEGKCELLNEGYDHILKLKEITLKPISVFTLVHLASLIEKMKEIEPFNTKKVGKLEELMSGVDENTQRALQYLRYMKNEEHERVKTL